VRRSSAVLVAVLAAALVLSACGSGPGAPAAAKVNTTRILRSDLNDQLEVLSNNTKWLKQVGDQFGTKTAAEPNGNVSAALAAAWLTALMNQAVVDQVFEAKDLKVTEANRTAAKTSAQQLFNTDQGSTFKTMPKWFRDEFLAGQARYEAVSEVAPPNPKPKDKDLAPLVQGAFAQYCQSGNAVFHILVPTRAAADQVEAELAAGQDFAAVAAARSTDGSSKTLGGFVGCIGGTNWSQLPQDFRDAVAPLPSGTTSAPIQTAAGFHVVKVSPFDLANARAFLAALYSSSLSPPIANLINARLTKAKIWVDPRYGKIAIGPVRVNPPQPPRVRNDPRDTTAARSGSS
jgi:hypothetical protein